MCCIQDKIITTIAAVVVAGSVQTGYSSDGEMVEFAFRK